MITSSSKRVIKSNIRNKNVECRKFVPPVQTDIRPPEPDARADDRKKTSSSAVNSYEPEKERLREIAEIVMGAKEEARLILIKANKTAEGIVEEAREEAKHLIDDAVGRGYQDGYEKGFAEGTERAREEYRTELEQELTGFKADMETALNSVASAKENCLRAYLDELKDCSIAVAEKVIHISLKSSGEIIKRMIVSATEKLKKTAWVKIYMNKVDYEMIMEADLNVIDELSRLSDNIKFIVMDKENRGNCIIEMPEEIVDISVDTQLENIREILENIRL